tara:strand:- start:697 stop:1272 length:576 start_codon:yes stop_codon:yes gene_type:complete
MSKNSILKTFTVINSVNSINDPFYDFILLLNYDNMYIDLKNSYQNNNNKIYDQFIKDYDRCKIYINNIREINNNIFIKYFELLFIANNYNIYDLYLFCTQAIMGYCLQIIHSKLPHNLYIGEQTKPKSLIYNILCKNNKITINIKKKLRIFFITQDGTAQTLHNILIKVYIPLYNNENAIMIYKILKNKII